MKDKKTISVIGMHLGKIVFVGAASAAGSALWTYMLRDKVHDAIWQMRRPKADNIIDFRKAKTRLSR